IRTYKVIPLSPHAGVLQWVDNTCPLGEYLSQAHKKYRPQDWPATQCRKMMSEEHAKAGSTAQSKLSVYNLISQRFQPVFRHFFLERYKDPDTWFERRVRYSRSVAVSSMIGFVLGIGDRHAQNILIDSTTAETIHIDLGIAFDQGKLLPTPERVPFRLTRDMVDGMGITGVDGVFRRCCEKTMQVLRDEADILLAILDVFRYDPLYHWHISPLKARKLQNDEAARMVGVLPARAVGVATKAAESSNKEAERALAAVRAKFSSDVGVECQVNDLIRMATSPENLCRLYPGRQRAADYADTVRD
ncbi:kinase-like domain-containing protein, partial [Thamnocephalis sphaerospora]